MNTKKINGKLPYPPSINNYYLNKTIHNRSGHLIKPRLPSVQKYVNDCLLLLKTQKLNTIDDEKLCVQLDVYPPDLKRRDLDNIAKVILDTLQRAGIYKDDYNIWKLTIERKDVRQFGEVEFTISAID